MAPNENIESTRPPTPLGMARKNEWREVGILKVENGYVVHVGCKTFVFEKWVDAIQTISDYWNNPKAAEKKYCGTNL